MMPIIEKVLLDNHVQYTQRERFLFQCQHGSGAGGGGVKEKSSSSDVPAAASQVRFEIEVCRLPLLSVNGVRFKRISGSSILYKDIASKISSGLTFTA